MRQVIGDLQRDAGFRGPADGEVADLHHDRAFVNGGVGCGNFRQRLILVQLSSLAVELGEEREFRKSMILGHCVVEGQLIGGFYIKFRLHRTVERDDGGQVVGRADAAVERQAFDAEVILQLVAPC